MNIEWREPLYDKFHYSVQLELVVEKHILAIEKWKSNETSVIIIEQIGTLVTGHSV